MSKPALYNDELKERIIQSAEAIFHYKWVAKSVGIDEDTLLKYRKQDKDLSDRLEEARSRFIRDNLKRARPDFKLQTADREIFGDKKEVNVTVNPVEELLKAYGIKSEGDDDRQTDEDVPRPSESEA